MHPQNNSAKNCAITPPPPLALFTPPLYWQAESLARHVSVCSEFGVFRCVWMCDCVRESVCMCMHVWSPTGVCALVKMLGYLHARTSLFYSALISLPCLAV